MRQMSLVMVVLIVGLSRALAADYSHQTTDKLIDSLTQIDGSTPGLDDRGSYDVFMAEGATPEFRGGLLPPRTPAIPPPMRELVRRGTKALPNLIAHLNDSRPTKLLVGEEKPIETFGGQYYSDEYDPRDVNATESPCEEDHRCRRFDGKYLVKIGDVCEVLIGQIVNRKLFAVRYQPTSILYVNSPIEMPTIAARIRKDWGGLDEKAHDASLLFDLRATDDDLSSWHSYRDALLRLRFYFPKTYAELTGTDLEKRRAFEKDEAARKSKEQQER